MRNRILPALWALVLFALALFLFTRWNTFPFHYHPDEPDKVQQVLTGEWKFEHPMLLLTASKLVVDLLQVPRTEQSVVVAGRWVSASLSALAVAALSLLAFLYRGWPGAVAAGLLLAFHHQFFELGHYMKEDSALLAGVALTFLAIALFHRSPGLGTAAFLGAACGVAVSGKYVGALMIVLALPVLLRRGGRPLASAAAFTAALVVTIAAINAPLLMDLSRFHRSLDKEVGRVVGGQAGMTRDIPNLQYTGVFHDNTTPVLIGFLILHVVLSWRRRRELTLPEWIYLLFPFGLMVLLSFSPKTNDRYFLPATAMLTWLAAFGALDLGRLLSKRIPLRIAVALCVALALLSEVPSFAAYWSAFRHDDRADAAAWIRSNLPGDAVLVRDARTSLPSPDDRKDYIRALPPLAQKVVPTRRYAADAGSLEELAREGVTHAVVSESDYGRYFLESLRPQAGHRDDASRRRAFYEDLFRRGKLLWKRDRGTVIYLHPGIEIWELPGA